MSLDKLYLNVHYIGKIERSDDLEKGLGYNLMKQVHKLQKELNVKLLTFKYKTETYNYYHANQQSMMSFKLEFRIDDEDELDVLNSQLNIIFDDFRKVEYRIGKHADDVFIEDNHIFSVSDELLKKVFNVLIMSDGLYASDNEEFNAVWQLNYQDIINELEKVLDNNITIMKRINDVSFKI